MLTPHRNLPLTYTLLVLTMILMVGLLGGCYSTQWERLDEKIKSEIGVKNKDYYVIQWGPPTRRAKLDDGGEVLTWEWQGFAQNQSGGHSQGWQKTLIFSPDGLLKDYKWQYWGMPVVAL